MTYSLPWGRNDRIEVEIPSAWKVAADHRAVERPRIYDLPRKVAEMLREPSDGPPLADLAKGAKNAVIVIDDVGRPTPANAIAPAVLNALIEAGIDRNFIKVVFATGTHRKMTREEMIAKAGGEIVEKIECTNHECRDSARLKHFGKTSRGTPVYINSIVADADVRVLVGTIEPHPQAGFGGGLKNILPGAAGAESVGHNHLILPSPERWNMIGTPPDENPMRLDIEEAARMLPGKYFIVNTVLGPDLAPVALVTGDAVAAHRRGTVIAREIYGVPLPHKMDAAIVSSFPMDEDLRQGVKGVANVPGAVKKGGVIICYLRCERGMEDVRPPKFKPPIGLAKAALKVMGSRMIYSLSNHLPKSVPVEARFVINFGLQVLKDYHVMIYSPALAKQTEGKFPEFLYDDQRKMFDRAQRLIASPSPEVCLIAEGGVSFPVVQS